MFVTEHPSGWRLLESDEVQEPYRNTKCTSVLWPLSHHQFPNPPHTVASMISTVGRMVLIWLVAVTVSGSFVSATCQFNPVCGLLARQD